MASQLEKVLNWIGQVTSKSYCRLFFCFQKCPIIFINSWLISGGSCFPIFFGRSCSLDFIYLYTVESTCLPPCLSCASSLLPERSWKLCFIRMNVSNRVLTNNRDEPTRRFAWYGYIEDITRWREDIYTGYYVTARGYEFYLRVFNSIPKLFRRPEERSRTFSENFRRFPMITFEEDPKMVRWYTNEFTNYHRYLHMWGYPIFTCEDIVSFLSICYHTVCH